jgi:hypothetical protein
MSKSRILSPSESAAQGADADDLEAARTRLAGAVKRAKGQAFTYQASLFPHGTADTLVGELRTAGWTVRLVPDSRDGDYYDIKPRR